MAGEQAPDEEKRPGTAEVAEAGATVSRGTPESAAFFLAALQVLEENHSSFARLMQKNGDDRQPETILRSIQRMASGEARVSGEMRVLLTFMMRGKRRRLAAKAAAKAAKVGQGEGLRDA
jgi:hypothetical protein